MASSVSSSASILLIPSLEIGLKIATVLGQRSRIRLLFGGRWMDGYHKRQQALGPLRDGKRLEKEVERTMEGRRERKILNLSRIPSHSRCLLLYARKEKCFPADPEGKARLLAFGLLTSIHGLKGRNFSHRQLHSSQL